MFFFWQKHNNVPSTFRSPIFGSSILMNGVLCVLFGIAILTSPELLAYIVAGFFIFFGISLIMMWWKIKS